MNRIVIFTEGGLIQEIQADHPDEIEIVEVCWDAEGSPEHIVELSGGVEAWVGHQEVAQLKINQANEFIIFGDRK